MTADARPTLPDFDTALAAVLAAAPPATAIETVSLGDALGRTLREAIVADRDLPPFDRSAMDGYAVRAADVHEGARLPVTADAPAGTPEVLAGPPGTCVRIATGAPVPAGLDAVVPHERTDRGDPVTFSGPAPAPGDAVHPRGADARAGDRLVPAGTRLGPAHLALAATVGRPTLAVARRPAVTVLTTGTEVRPADADVAAHQIRNSNAPMLSALATRMGAEVVGVEHVLDDHDATRDAIAAAVARSELVLTVGGISAGDRDHVAGALDELGATPVLRGAAIQPGKPITAMRLPRSGAGNPDESVLALCLPGNPVSSMACACLFAWPALAATLGTSPPPWRTLPLLESVRPNARREAFRPAIRSADGVTVPTWAGSGDLAHTAPAGGLVRLPILADPLPAGTRVPYLAWPGDSS